MVRHLVLCLSFVSILGCGREEASKPASDAPTEKSSPPPAEVEKPAADPQPDPLPAKDGFFMAEGAPEPRACKVADDCRGGTIPDLHNPCCQNPRTLEPYARAYQKWLNEWRRDHCEAVTCPPPPNPSRPPDCAFEVDCIDGVCVDACP